MALPLWDQKNEAEQSNRRPDRNRRPYQDNHANSPHPSFEVGGSNRFKFGFDDQITDDPHSQISLIYYPNRDGLEDRVFRIKTERSGASTPEPRTSHNVTNVEVLEMRGEEVDVRYNFNTLNHRYKVTDSFFGTTFVTLRRSGDELLISAKKIVLKNDYIRQVIDVYHI